MIASKNIIFALGMIVLPSVELAYGQDAALVEAAKKEGTVVWYTTQIIDPLVRDVISAFTKKYGIKVEYYRGNSSDVALKIQQEGKAGRIQADVFDGTTSSEALKKEGLVERWIPDVAKTFQSDFVDPDGYWVGTNDTLHSVAINTNLVKIAEAPKSWDDLLDPKFKNRIVWGSTPSVSAAPGFIGLVLKELGEDKGQDFIKKFATQMPTANSGSARAVIDQVIAGEYALALQMFPDQALTSAARGAPVKWLPMKPAMTAVVSTIAMTKGAPHPNAAKLLYTFIVSEEGQRFFRESFYIPTNPKVAPIDPDLEPGKLRAVHISPAEANASMNKWHGIYRDVYR